MNKVVDRPHVTAAGWPSHATQYGTTDTYRLAAAWLRDCPTVSDWGGASGYFCRFLPPSVAYTVVDGTQQLDGQVLADLTTYTAPSDGILLRHVLDNTPDWRPILANALAAFRRRLVVVTFLADAKRTCQIVRRDGWPYWQFNPDDLRVTMIPWLARDESIDTTHSERVYYLEKPE